MEMYFSDWLEAISIPDARRARKGMSRSWKKYKYAPHSHRQFKKFQHGTFGLEIEFRIDSEDGMMHYSEEQLKEIKEELQSKLYDVIWARPDYSSRHTPNQLRDDWQEFMEDKYPPFESIHDWEDDDNEEPEKPDREDWQNDEEFQDDLSDWKDDHEKWKEQRDEIEKQIDEFDHEKLQEEFIKDIVDEERWEDYEIYNHDHYLDDFETKAEEYREMLEDLGWTVSVEGDDSDWNPSQGWYIHRDGNGILELTSPIMTQEDISGLIKLFSHAQDERTDGNTSCHIHVGMPRDTDGFDLVAMTTLADESQLTRDLPGRNFSQHADFNRNLQYSIANDLEPGIYDKDEFMSKLRNLDRTGTNITSFSRHGTVEFRYLSSEALKEPDMVFGWVNYFLMLPKIARGRKQIKINHNNTYLTRMPNGGVRVDKSPEGRVRQEPGSPEDLRRQREISPYEKQKKKLKRGIVERYVDNMSLYHFSMQIGGGSEQHITGMIKSVITAFMKDVPIVKKFMAVHPEDTQLSDWENYMQLAQHLKMSDIFRYSAESIDYSWLRRAINDIVEKRFDVVRKNTEGWKKHGLEL